MSNGTLADCAALAASAGVGAVSRDKVEKISALFPGTPVVWTPNGIDLADWQARGR